MELKLGKRNATFDHRDLKLADYLDKSKLPTPPRRFGHEGVVSNWGVLGNDRVGNCVFAGAAHETMMWTLEGDAADAQFTDADALSDYSAVTGYNPADPNTDQGTVVRDALTYRQNTGIRSSDGTRHKIGAYVGLRLGDLNQLYTALYLFGAVGIGINFPTSAMDQFNQGRDWDPIAGGSPLEGGHYIPVVARRGLFSERIAVVTWGRVQYMTPRFYLGYCDEAWVMLSEEMLKGGKSLEGFDLATLRTDLARVKG